MIRDIRRLNLFFAPAETALRSKCPGVFHTSVCLEDGSVIFEAKDGAYKPISPEDVL